MFCDFSVETNNTPACLPLFTELILEDGNVFINVTSKVMLKNLHQCVKLTPKHVNPHEAVLSIDGTFGTNNTK